jgi:hypothetical protein
MNVEKLKEEAKEFKQKTAKMTEAETIAELAKSMMLSEMQRRKKIKERASRDTRLIECCDFMKCLQLMFRLNAEKWREENKKEG